ncbi:hypothetical protein J6590_042965 [Homalodisca vitripennis]|nr:hypothetical protein J6590_042965 [Homalodisca vitripennis]
MTVYKLLKTFYTITALKSARAISLYSAAGPQESRTIELNWDRQYRSDGSECLNKFLTVSLLITIFQCMSDTHE